LFRDAAFAGFRTRGWGSRAAAENGRSHG
jgi:hypothetical protein